MAIDFSGHDISLIATEDLSGQQYRFVCQHDDTHCDMPDAATEVPIGILQNAPTIGQVAQIRISGTSKLVMNDAVAVQARIKMEYVAVDDNGKGDAADTEGDQERGICIMASGAENDIGGVLLIFNETSVP